MRIVRIQVCEKAIPFFLEGIADVQADNIINSKVLLGQKAFRLLCRIRKLCGGDMSFASALTYDFEVFSAAQEKWLEVSSVSNFESYQTNRMKIRFKDENGKTRLLHSLNGSSLALPRIVACLLENFQTAEGIKLPAVLHSYFGDSIVK